jgi:predicted ATPase
MLGKRRGIAFPTLRVLFNFQVGFGPACKGTQVRFEENQRVWGKTVRLASFSITNFRSIVGTNKVPLYDLTVLIGKNNEGKSNILRALSIAMRTLAAHADEPTSIRIAASERRYLWNRDFPIALQRNPGKRESVFRLEFSLDTAECEEFRQKIQSSLNGTLPIELRFGRVRDPEIRVAKRGPGGTALSKKSAKIAKYIASKIEFNYIPAVRTEEEAESVVQEMLAQELARLEENPEYIDALQKISDLQQPVLDQVSASIKRSLSQFLPNINAVQVQVPPGARKVALRNQCRVEIDDGAATLLQHKGDGVKSLAAIGLLKDKQETRGAASIVAIEEPEAHLHPGAMHSLREVIEALARVNQVVITTHCPLFVNRHNPNRNVLIDSNSAKPAKDISAIRALLGVRASDNLVNAGHVLVVEGDEDAVILSALLPGLSDGIAKALRQHLLVIEPMRGAGNLAYILALLANALCTTHVLLDNDEAGRRAFENAQTQGLLTIADVTFTNCRGAPNSELEDCLDPATYTSAVLRDFGVELRAPQFRGNKKWSDRVRACFQAQGKLWNDKIEGQVKAIVAECISSSPSTALIPHHAGTVTALVRALEVKLGCLSRDVQNTMNERVVRSNATAPSPELRAGEASTTPPA